MNSEKDFDKTPGSKKTITENRKNREGNMKNQKKIPIKGTRNPRNLLVQINKILMKSEQSGRIPGNHEKSQTNSL